VALSASLFAMTASLSTPQMTGASQMATEALAFRDAVAPLCDRDARTYLDVIAAQRRHDASSLADALSAATDVPMEIVEAGARLAEMAAELAEAGNPSLRGDALVAAVLAGAGVEAAATLARINLAELPDDERHVVARSRLDDTTRSVQRARRAAAGATGAGERG
jgi:formiminotetrahydrofolate cyclodeaminase